MVPRIHKKGKSFRGAALYVLHDKGTTATADRVGWTATRNLATEDPEVAWRVMAATAMDQGRLKAEAGVKNTGRKSRDHVLHLTLSWHGSESEGLDRDEMMRAANQAIHALDAGDRQALIAAHRDTDEPHVHILINRVSPDDGRMLSSSKEKLKLSAWAQNYEEERGQVLCEERVLNNQARGMQKYTRDQQHTPYHIHQLETANDNKPGFDRAQAEQRSRDAALAREHEDRRQRRLHAWSDMETRHRQSLQDLDTQHRRSIWSAERETREAYRPSWVELNERHTAQLEAWEQGEERFLGRVKNAFRAADWRGVMRAEDRREKLRELYGAFSSSGARLETLKRAQEAETRALRQQEAAAEQQRREAIEQQTELDRLERLSLFEAERQSLILTNELEDAADRAQWQQRNDDRRAAYEQLRDRESSKPDHDNQNSIEAEPVSPADATGDGLSPEEREWMRRYMPNDGPSNDNTRDHDHDRS